jgi:hypothetical protein
MRVGRKIGTFRLERHANTIHVPSSWMAWMVMPMAENVHQFRPKPGDSEKITINLGYVDLGHIDLTALKST